MGGCKLCGAPHSTCGPSPVVIPIDQRVTTKGEDTMTLKRYETTVHGNATTLVLNDEDAKRLGLLDAPAGKAAPTNKATKPAANKARAPRAPRAKKPAAAKLAAPADEKPADEPAATGTPEAE